MTKFPSMLNELTVGEVLTLMEQEYAEDLNKHTHTEYVVENHQIMITI